MDLEKFVWEENQVPIAANGGYPVFVTPPHKYCRIMIASTEHDGAYNHDQWWFYNNRTQMGGVFEDTLNKPTPFNYNFPIQDFWLEPDTYWYILVSNWTVLGNIDTHVYYEWRSITSERVGDLVQEVRIRDQPIEIDPLGGLKKLLGR